MRPSARRTIHFVRGVSSATTARIPFGTWARSACRSSSRPSEEPLRWPFVAWPFEWPPWVAQSSVAGPSGSFVVVVMARASLPPGSDARAERIARSRISRIESRPEPLRALRGGPVRPRLGVDPLPGRALDPVVADGGRGLEGLVEVAGLELLVRVRVMRPHARVAVGLEL